MSAARIVHQVRPCPACAARRPGGGGARPSESPRSLHRTWRAGVLQCARAPFGWLSATTALSPCSSCGRCPSPALPRLAAHVRLASGCARRRCGDDPEGDGPRRSLRRLAATYMRARHQSRRRLSQRPLEHQFKAKRTCLPRRPRPTVTMSRGPALRALQGLYIWSQCGQQRLHVLQVPIKPPNDLALLVGHSVVRRRHARRAIGLHYLQQARQRPQQVHLRSAARRLRVRPALSAGRTVRFADVRRRSRWYPTPA